MLATAWPTPFDDEDWWFEVKWDGYRAIVGAEGGAIRIRSRRGLDLMDRFPGLIELELPDNTVIDGEVVALDDSGRPSFSALQAGRPVHFVVFDVLHLDGDTTGMPYESRLEALASLDISGPVVRPEPLRASGLAMFEAVVAEGLEGMVAKRSGSLYYPGKRSADWRKVSVVQRIRAVVGGYTEGQGGRASTFGSLILGLYEDDGLRWIGSVGSGFNDDQLATIHREVQEIRRPDSPFNGPVGLPGSPTWVEPSVVVAVEFKEWTADRHLRAPVFKGVELADPESVTWESERG
jgi:bifunctional non-homologous end joining protein LigD